MISRLQVTELTIRLDRVRPRRPELPGRTVVSGRRENGPSPREEGPSTPAAGLGGVRSRDVSSEVPRRALD